VKYLAVLPLWYYCGTKQHGFVPFVLNILAPRHKPQFKGLIYHSNTVKDKQPIKIILLLGTPHSSQSESPLVKVFFGGKELEAAEIY